MAILAVIPARYASTRFPGKPLANQTGKYLVQHVYDRTQASDLIDRVIVATDDERILEAVKSFGGEAALTRDDHPSGTHRVAEVAQQLGLVDDDLILNVQGDEPELVPRVLDRLIERMESGPGAERIGTLAAPFDGNGPRTGAGSPLDPNCVKVVVDASGRALYFSRSPIPYPRDGGGTIDKPSRWLMHLGVYAYRVGTLREITDDRFPAGRLERIESLEQLRWVEQGFSIAVEIVDHSFVGIDTPQDYAAFVSRTAAPT